MIPNLDTPLAKDNWPPTQEPDDSLKSLLKTVMEIRNIDTLIAESKERSAELREKIAYQRGFIDGKNSTLKP